MDRLHVKSYQISMMTFDLVSKSAKSAKFSATVLPVHVILVSVKESICQQVLHNPQAHHRLREVLEDAPLTRVSGLARAHALGWY